MGAKPAKQVRDELVASVHIGDSARLARALGQIRAAQAGQGSAATRSILSQWDLNRPAKSGKPLLHLAVASRDLSCVQQILAMPGVNPNSLDKKGFTALHCSAQTEEVMQALLDARADPLCPTPKGETAVDLFRKLRDVHKVRILESQTKIWEGGIDYYKRLRWRPAHLVLHRSRRLVMNEVCPSCGCRLQVPVQQCPGCCCLFERLDAVIYDDGVAPNEGAGAKAHLKFKVYPLPISSSLLHVRRLDEAGVETAKNALVRGSLRRAAQNYLHAGRRSCGLSCKVFCAERSGKVLEDLCFRVSTEVECAELIYALQNPLRAAIGSILDGAAAAALRVQVPIPPPPTQDTLAGNPVWESLGVRSCLEAESMKSALPIGVPDCAKDVPIPDSPRTSAGEHSPVSSDSSMATPTVAETLVGLVNMQAMQASSGQLQVAEPDVCPLCMDVEADSAVVPCGHFCGCYGCLTAVQGTANAQCPICRGPVDSVMRIYKS